MLRKFTVDKLYSFYPSENWIDNVKKTNVSKINDCFESYEANLNVSGKLIVCSDSSKVKNFCNKTEMETYEEYQKLINEYDMERDKWIYNIIDGESEQEHVIYRDDKILIIPDYKWNVDDIVKIHLLTIPIDKTLRTIRSLEDRSE